MFTHSGAAETGSSPARDRQAAATAGEDEWTPQGCDAAGTGHRQAHTGDGVWKDGACGHAVACTRQPLQHVSRPTDGRALRRPRSCCETTYAGASDAWRLRSGLALPHTVAHSSTLEGRRRAATSRPCPCCPVQRPGPGSSDLSVVVLVHRPRCAAGRRARIINARPLFERLWAGHGPEVACPTPPWQAVNTWDARLSRHGCRMGQPPSTHVGGQGRTPASAVMAITLAQATCVRASSSTSRPCPRLTSLPMPTRCFGAAVETSSDLSAGLLVLSPNLPRGPSVLRGWPQHCPSSKEAATGAGLCSQLHFPALPPASHHCLCCARLPAQLPFPSDLSAGLLVLSPNLPRGPSPESPTLPLFPNKAAPRVRAQHRLPFPSDLSAGLLVLSPNLPRGPSPESPTLPLFPNKAAPRVRAQHRLPFPSDLSAGLLVLSPNLPRGPSPESPTLPLFPNKAAPRVRAQHRVPPHASRAGWQTHLCGDAQLVGRMGERMGQPPNTHVGGQGRTPASAVMAITLAQATCVRASVGALGVCGAPQRVMEAEWRHLPVHGDMSLAPVSPSPLAYGQSSTSRPCPRLTSLPMPTPTPSCRSPSDLSAGLLVLSPNLPRGPSPESPTLPLFPNKAAPRARAQPRGMPSWWAMGERMGQPPNTHVGGQGRTPASAVMAITLAQATCVRASVGALGVSGAQQRVMEAERPVHGDMSLAPVSPSPLAYGQSSTSRPCPRLTSLPMPHRPAAVLLRPLRRPAGAQPQPAPGPVPRAPTLPLFPKRLPRARAQPRGMPSCWAGERMGQPPNTHVGGQGRTPASAVMAITLAQATCVRASVGALGVSGAQQRVMEAERPSTGTCPRPPSPLLHSRMDRAPHPGPAPASHHCPCPRLPAQLPFSSDLSAGLLVLSPNLPRGPSPRGPNTAPLPRRGCHGPGHSPGGCWWAAWAGERMGQPPNTHVGGQGRTPASAVMAITLAQATCVRASVGALGVSGAQQRVMEAERPVISTGTCPWPPSPLLHSRMDRAPHPGPAPASHHCPCPPPAQLPFSSDLSAGLLVLSPNLPRGPSPGAPTLPLFQERLPRARAQPRGMPSCWAGERMGQPPNTHVGGQGRTPASAVMAITLARATCVRASVGALGVSGAQQRVMEAERPVHGDMSLAPVSPSPLAYGQSSTSRPCPRLTSLPMPTAPAQLPFSSDLSAGLLVLSPNLPRGPSPGAPTLPLFQERLPRARAQPRVPPHASMAGWQTDLCGRLERQGLSHMRGWHLAAALIVASETGMPSCWAGERMGQPPNTHVGGQGRTPASAVMAITLAQATCVRASVGALGVSGAQQRVMEAERPVHGDMSLAPVSPSPLAYGQSSTSRPCPRLTSLPMPTYPQLPFSSDLSAGLLVLSPNLPRGPSPGAPTLPLFQGEAATGPGTARGMPSCWAGERMGQPPNTHVGGQGRTPASAVMAITLAQATCVRASVGALGVSGAQQRVMEAERPSPSPRGHVPWPPSPLLHSRMDRAPHPGPAPASHHCPCPPPAQLPFSSDLSAGLLVLSPNLPRGPSPGAPTLPLFQERLPRARAQPRVPPHASMAGWQTDLCGRLERQGLSHMRGWHLAAALIVASETGMPSCWAGERMGQPPNTHVGGQGRTPASAVMAITLAQATCVRASVGALGVSGAQQRVMEAERPVHGDMSLAPVSPSPLAYGQSSTSRPCPPPHITAHAHLPQLPFSSDLSAGLLVLSPNLPRGPSPGAPTLPLFPRRGCHGPGHSPGYLPTPPWRAGRPTCAVAWNGKGCRT
ncbi:MAG: hypothetical protein WDW36_010184 [Sanguina aurantia]